MSCSKRCCDFSVQNVEVPHWSENPSQDKHLLAISEWSNWNASLLQAMMRTSVWEIKVSLSQMRCHPLDGPVGKRMKLEKPEPSGKEKCKKCDFCYKVHELRGYYKLA